MRAPESIEQQDFWESIAWEDRKILLDKNGLALYPTHNISHSRLVIKRHALDAKRRSVDGFYSFEHNRHSEPPIPYV
jgi:hypothetical protein